MRRARDVRRALDDRVKQALDVTAATVLLLLTTQTRLVAAIAIRVRLGSPVLFRQARPGLDQEPFEIIRFRTMLGDQPTPGVVDAPAYRGDRIDA